MPKIEKESDALHREYRRLVNTIYRLTRKHSGDDPLLWIRLNQIQKRQYEICKELEECTGVKILQTKEEILEENERIQGERDELNKKMDDLFLEMEWEEYVKKQKSLPSKESKFKSSSAPGQTTLDVTEE